MLMNALEILSARLSSSSHHFVFMDAFVAIECVRCIKEVLNSQGGVHYFISSPDLVCQMVYGKKKYFRVGQSSQSTIALFCFIKILHCL